MAAIVGGLPLPDGTEEIEALADRVLESAKKTGFALMKANYAERDALELPGGKIRGLAREASGIASGLRDSIWTRFDSLRFHRRLLANVDQQLQARLPQIEDSDERFRTIWTALWHSQYLFDDLVFNTVSLFDYLGNTVWFAFHGKNHIKKKWNKAYEAARRPDLEKNLSKGLRIHGSATGQAVLSAHQTLVNALYGYRSDLIHNRIDGPDIYNSDFWRESWHPGFRLPLPQGYMRRLQRRCDGRSEPGPEDMPGGATDLVKRAGEITLEILEKLRDDVGWSEEEPLVILG